MSKSKEVLGQVATYSGAMMISQVVTLAAAIMSRRILGPSQIGIWAFIQVIITYASLSAMGVTNAATREIPFYVGKGDQGKAQQIKNVVFTFSHLSTLFVAIGILSFALIQRNVLQQEIFVGLLSASGIVLLQRVNDYLIVLLRAYKLFAIAGKQMIYSSIVNAFLVLVLSYQFKLYGFMIAMILSLIFNIAYIQFKHKFNLKFSWDMSQIKSLIGYGLPLMLVSLISTIFLSIDKIMIVNFLNFEALGLYGVAILATNYLCKFPSSVGAVLLPNFQEKYGAREDKRDLVSYLDKATLAFCLITPVFIGFLWFFSGVLIELFLPKFIGCVLALKILIISTYFVSLTQPYEHFIVAIKKHLSLFPIIAVCCVLAIGFNYFFLKNGWGIEGVAVATMVTFIVKFILSYAVAGRELFTLSENLKRFMPIALKFIYMVGMLVAIDQFKLNGSPWLVSVFKFSIFLILVSPFLIKMNREFKIFSMLQERMRR